MPSRLQRNARRRPQPTALERLLRTAQFMRDDPSRQLRLALLLLLGLVFGGSVGYALIENMPLLDALYMTIITLTTVGFGEVRPLTQLGKVFTMGLIVTGVGISAWAVSNAAEAMLGETFWTTYRKRRIRELVMNLTDHFVVCGYGRLGRQIVRDLEARGEPFVIIDHAEEVGEELLERRVPHLIDDASQDETLHEAGVERARGLVACMDSDATNVLTILTAKEMNPKLLVVARANSEGAESKLLRAGADRVVTPEAIGGHRLALALLRPAVHDFFSRVFSFGTASDADIGQLLIEEDSPFHGQTVAGCDLRRVRSVSILGVRTATGSFDLNPAPERELKAGETLIVIGPAEAIYELEAMFGAESG